MTTWSCSDFPQPLYLDFLFVSKMFFIGSKISTIKCIQSDRQTDARFVDCWCEAPGVTLSNGRSNSNLVVSFNLSHRLSADGCFYRDKRSRSRKWQSWNHNQLFDYCHLTCLGAVVPGFVKRDIWRSSIITIAFVRMHSFCGCFFLSQLLFCVSRYSDNNQEYKLSPDWIMAANILGRFRNSDCAKGSLFMDDATVRPDKRMQWDHLTRYASYACADAERQAK